MSHAEERQGRGSLQNKRFTSPCCLKDLCRMGEWSTGDTKSLVLRLRAPMLSIVISRNLDPNMLLLRAQLSWNGPKGLTRAQGQKILQILLCKIYKAAPCRLINQEQEQSFATAYKIFLSDCHNATSGELATQPCAVGR